MQEHVDINQMRDFIELVEFYAHEDSGNRAPLMEEAMTVQDAPPSDALLHDLREVVFKLRSFTEGANNQDYAFGYESGMQRAAEWIERVIRNHEPPQE